MRIILKSLHESIKTKRNAFPYLRKHASWFLLFQTILRILKRFWNFWPFQYFSRYSVSRYFVTSLLVTSLLCLVTPRLSFDALISRSSTGVLPALLISNVNSILRKECNNLVCTRNKIQARRFGSTNLSVLVNIAKYMYTLFEYKTK